MVYKSCSYSCSYHFKEQVYTNILADNITIDQVPVIYNQPVTRPSEVCQLLTVGTRSMPLFFEERAGLFYARGRYLGDDSMHSLASMEASAEANHLAISLACNKYFDTTPCILSVTTKTGLSLAPFRRRILGREVSIQPSYGYWKV